MQQIENFSGFVPFESFSASIHFNGFSKEKTWNCNCKSNFPCSPPTGPYHANWFLKKLKSINHNNLALLLSKRAVNFRMIISNWCILRAYHYITSVGPYVANKVFHMFFSYTFLFNLSYFLSLSISISWTLQLWKCVQSRTEKSYARKSKIRNRKNFS